MDVITEEPVRVTSDADAYVVPIMLKPLLPVNVIPSVFVRAMKMSIPAHVPDIHDKSAMGTQVAKLYPWLRR